MAGKQLEKGSIYEKYDLNGDGVVYDEDLAKAERMIEIEAAAARERDRDKKEDQLRQMAWVAMISMVLFTAFIFTPFLGLERLAAIDNILSMFYIAQAGVVATFFGSSAYMSKNH